MNAAPLPDLDRLNPEALKTLIRIQQEQLSSHQQRLAKQNMRLVLTDALKRIVAREGFDPVYGARPLKRAIQRFVLDPLSLELLEGHFKEGDVIVADVIRDKVQFLKEISAI